MSSNMLPKVVNKNKTEFGGLNEMVEGTKHKNMHFIIDSLKNNKNCPLNFFTNKEIRDYHYKNNLLYRLIYCYSSYACSRVNNKVLSVEETDNIWNFAKETDLYTSYVNYCVNKLKENPLPKNKFIFLMQFFLFCEDEKQIRNIYFLISDKRCQDFFGRSIKLLTDHIKQAQINKHNSRDIEDVILKFCVSYVYEMYTSLIFFTK